MILDELEADVLQEVPEAPLMTVRNMIAWAGRELCTEADVWVVRDGPIVVAVNTDYPQILFPSGAEPLRIIKLEDAEERELHQGVDFEQVEEDRVEFTLDRDETQLYGKLAVRPQQGNQLPDRLIKSHFEALRFGAKYRLLMMPQPWRDVQLADYWRRYFEAEITKAKQQSVYGHARGGRRVQARKFI